MPLEFRVFNYKAIEIIPLSIRNFWYPNEIRDYKKVHYMVLGIVITDHPGNLDFKKMLESKGDKIIYPYDQHMSREENYDAIPRVDSSFYTQ